MTRRTNAEIVRDGSHFYSAAYVLIFIFSLSFQIDFCLFTARKLLARFQVVIHVEHLLSIAASVAEYFATAVHLSGSCLTPLTSCMTQMRQNQQARLARSVSVTRVMKRSLRVFRVDWLLVDMP
jgi:hypothetical protein